MGELKETFIKLLNNYYSSQLFFLGCFWKGNNNFANLKIKTLPFSFLFVLASTKLDPQNNIVVAVIPAGLNIGSHDFLHH